MQRTIRYQGAVIRDDHILLIQHRHYANGHSYWLLPGGGREGDATPEACAQREVREATHLHVEVDRHLLDDPDMPGGTYQRLHTKDGHSLTRWRQAEILQSLLSIEGDHDNSSASSRCSDAYGLDVS